MSLSLSVPVSVSLYLSLCLRQGLYGSGPKAFLHVSLSLSRALQNYQEKFFACQRQVAQLQYEMGLLRQGFESLEASHKAQEVQLEKSTEATATLKERLQATLEEVRRQGQQQRQDSIKETLPDGRHRSNVILQKDRRLFLCSHHGVSSSFLVVPIPRILSADILAMNDCMLR